MLNFPNATRPIIEQLLYFHDWLIVFLTPVALMVICLIISKRKFNNRTIIEAQNLETLWTLGPCVIIIFIGLPSLRLLYMERFEAPGPSLKAQGHQWYWHYEYPGVDGYDSYMGNGLRLLDVDHRLIITTGTRNLLVTAADVLHSWTVPTLGIKADAVPGRVNKLVADIKRCGYYYGQCREICGSNHRFIPIRIECYFNLLFTLKVRECIVKDDRNSIIVDYGCGCFFYPSWAQNSGICTNS